MSQQPATRNQQRWLFLFLSLFILISGTDGAVPSNSGTQASAGEKGETASGLTHRPPSLLAAADLSDDALHGIGLFTGGVIATAAVAAALRKLTGHAEKREIIGSISESPKFALHDELVDLRSKVETLEAKLDHKLDEIGRHSEERSVRLHDRIDQLTALMGEVRGELKHISTYMQKGARA